MEAVAATPTRTLPASPASKTSRETDQTRSAGWRARGSAGGGESRIGAKIEARPPATPTPADPSRPPRAPPRHILCAALAIAPHTPATQEWHAPNALEPRSGTPSAAETRTGASVCSVDTLSDTQSTCGVTKACKRLTASSCLARAAAGSLAGDTNDAAGYTPLRCGMTVSSASITSAHDSIAKP